jgi:penicillin-binding protein 1C
LGSIYPDQGWRLEDQSNVEQLGIKKVDVCASTGDLPGKHCPQTLKSWFIPGVSPIKVSDVHRSIAIDSKTGLRACDLREESIDYQVYEIWPSDFLRIFKQAGISLNSPPPYHADCLLEDKNSTGLQPKIVSPISSADYLLQKHEENIIEFSAIVDSDVEKLYWFVNNNYIGNVSPTRSLSWKAKVGTHNITLVDDFGRSSSKLIRVINVY